MEKLKAIGLVAGFIVISVAVLVGSWKISGRYLNSQASANNTKITSCQQKGQSHVVIIKNNKANPKHTDGKLCDTLTITNEDDTGRLIAFGLHEHHQPYDGVAEKELHKGESLTVTLNQAGTFLFHDHIEDIVQGDFTVTK